MTDDDEEGPPPKIITLIAYSLMSLGIGCFGAANWQCHFKPNPISVKVDMPKEQFEYMAEDHRRKVEAAERGDGAVLPFVLAVPATLVGIAGAAAFGIGAVIRFQEIQDANRAET